MVFFVKHFKIEVNERKPDVTCLYSNKKVTKEFGRAQVGTLARLVEILQALPVSEGWYIEGAVRRAANKNHRLPVAIAQ